MVEPGMASRASARSTIEELNCILAAKVGDVNDDMGSHPGTISLLPLNTLSLFLMVIDN